jgi:ornithine cyclodeaminase/alanine dehydrogenase-like protein (mu-crystallin family)
MLYLPESTAAYLISLEDAISAVESAFSSLANDTARVFPVASAQGLKGTERWAVKSGYDRNLATVGFKVGTNWPGNKEKGLPAHASTVVLLDPLTGFAQALIGAAHLTVMRTAAADAVAVKHLARVDATTLAVVGAGHQAFWDVKAISLVRFLAEIRVTSRDFSSAERMAGRLRSDGLPAEAMMPEQAVVGADIIVTATPAQSPVLRDEWVAPGAHVSAMGADSYGKQELPVSLLERALLFCDVPDQAITIGEFQTIARSNGSDHLDITSIGDVINRTRTGRLSTDAITVFDSSGTAVQDLAICQIALDRAHRLGSIRHLDD